MPPRRWRYGSSGKRRRSCRAVSGSSSASRTSAVSRARSRRAAGTRAATVCISRLATASYPRRRWSAWRRAASSVTSEVTPGCPSRSDPIHDPRRSSAGASTGRVPVRPASPATAPFGPRAAIPSSARSTARPRRGIATNSVSSKMASAERTSSSGVGAMARRSPVCHSSVISSRRRRRRSASSSGVVRGSSMASSSRRMRRCATRRVRRRASVGWAVRTGWTSIRASSATTSSRPRLAPRRATASPIESSIGRPCARRARVRRVRIRCRSSARLMSWK